MADDLYDVLTRFHREVVRPELNEIRSRLDGMASREELQSMRAEMATREELQSMRAEMATRVELQSMRAEMATRVELQSMRAEMATGVELQSMRAEMVTWPVLMRFQTEMVEPGFESIRADIGAMATKADMLSYMDDIYNRFDRLESEYQALNAAVGRLEQQMTEQNVDRLAVRSELVELKDQVSQLTDRIADLEKDLN